MAKNHKGNPENLKPFRAGKSGNPSGKPKGFADFKAWCREHSEEAGEALLGNLSDEEGAVRNKAAEVIWAYAWGKPTQAVTLSDPEGGPVGVKATVKHEAPCAEELAAILRHMAGAGALPSGEGAPQAPAGPDAEADEVLGPLPDATPGGIPSP